MNIQNKETSFLYEKKKKYIANSYWLCKCSYVLCCVSLRLLLLYCNISLFTILLHHLSTNIVVSKAVFKTQNSLVLATGAYALMRLISCISDILGKVVAYRVLTSEKDAVNRSLVNKYLLFIACHVALSIESLLKAKNIIASRLENYIFLVAAHKILSNILLTLFEYHILANDNFNFVSKSYNASLLDNNKSLIVEFTAAFFSLNISIFQFVCVFLTTLSSICLMYYYNGIRYFNIEFIRQNHQLKTCYENVLKNKNLLLLNLQNIVSLFLLSGWFFTSFAYFEKTFLKDNVVYSNSVVLLFHFFPRLMRIVYKSCSATWIYNNHTQTHCVLLHALSTFFLCICSLIYKFDIRLLILCLALSFVFKEYADELKNVCVKHFSNSKNIYESTYIYKFCQSIINQLFTVAGLLLFFLFRLFVGTSFAANCLLCFVCNISNILLSNLCTAKKQQKRQVFQEK